MSGFWLGWLVVAAGFVEVAAEARIVRVYPAPFPPRSHVRLLEPPPYDYETDDDD